ncbi:hypothetical protein COT42_06575 [Candidatus Saganbacteria bacterium CG08_land_8_20_14_0_20_45_16]|uniref:Nucleoside phosphorylase domain-containing protein n=1 Tax=Candidatus Saganbacteria bacterium CG08_land_8_20_14_0_20_45_16 TaxID=2014293 RepID=A0A2H0XVH7_UNCSA|nr:MAG: hypothetical protein COT42_06575 [Candidatus Saganbacteria bacterium CG08_land_8_20_14_0_20_45_16]
MKKGPEYFQAFFAVKPAAIQRTVLVSPIIYPNQFEKMLGQKGQHSRALLGYLLANFKGLTFIKTAMSQAAVADLVLLLKGTKCRQVIFLGAIGALASGFKIGDTYATDKAQEIYSFASLHDETVVKLKALKKQGVIGIDIESQAFFSAAKKVGLKAQAYYVITDLPLCKPFYKPQTPKERQKIREAVALLCQKQLSI